jgi:hypothetical protein
VPGRLVRAAREVILKELLTTHEIPVVAEEREARVFLGMEEILQGRLELDLMAELDFLLR